jgi:peptidyl-prolyl cis-trans isomerase C
VTVRPQIKLNGVVLPSHMIAAEAQHHPASTPAASFKTAARALIVRTLLLEEAKRHSISAEPEFVAPGKRETDDDAQIRALIEALVPVTEPDEEHCRAFYEADPSRFRGPDLFEASHILFVADPRDSEIYAAAAARAVAIIDELARSPGRFESLARECSQCESRATGGRLGQITSGETVPEFERALEHLEEGQVAPQPVRSRFGVHVLRLDARASGKTLPFDYVHERISLFLAEKSWRRDVAKFVEGLVVKARIEGLDMMPAEQSETVAA